MSFNSNTHCPFLSNVKPDVTVSQYIYIFFSSGRSYCDLREVAGEAVGVDKVVAVDNQRQTVGQIGVTQLSTLQ